MTLAINIFDSLDDLEQKCPECSTIIDLDVTTHYDDTLNAHVCAICGHTIGSIQDTISDTE